MKCCAVCGRTSDQVSLLIQGRRDTCVCNECIQLFSELLSHYSSPTTHSKEPWKERTAVLKPHEIKAELDKRIVGQDKAKTILSVALYDQLLYWNGLIGPNYKKNNLLFIGPSGVGKTFLVENVARILNIPLLLCDSTTFSEVGYVGEDVTHILERLYYEADYDIIKAQKSIVHIDEIDKINKLDKNQAFGRDVSGEGVQQALLKMIEGKNAEVSVVEKNGAHRLIRFDTSGILFIFSGAFIGIEENGNLNESLLHFGMLPELIGRTPIIVKLDALTKDDLLQILTGTDFPVIKMYKDLFAVDNINLHVTDEALSYIAESALALNTGARGLFAILARIMYPLRYNCIEQGLDHIILSRELIELA